MFNKNVQYVNIIRSQQNIKIDYTILKDDNVVKNEQSVFLLDNDQLSLDTTYKLQSLEKSVDHTYITAICDDIEQKIVSKDEAIENGIKEIDFDTNHSIVLNDNIVQEIKEFYNYGNIDYLISPFTILQNILWKKLHANSLNILILNNHLYCIILNSEQRIAFSATEQLTPFEDIKQSEFYTDEVNEQKLYEEIYLLELEDKISKIIAQFYEEQSDKEFVESVNIFYDIKQLNNEQIKQLNETLMLNVYYEDGLINTILYQIVQKNDTKKINFIQPRAKKFSFNSKTLILVLIISLAITGGIFTYMQSYKEKPIEKPKKEQKKKVKVIKEILLPDHNLSNTNTKQLLIDIFNTIDDSGVLKEIQLQQNESTLIYTFKNKDSYNNFVRPKILQIYKNSENILTSDNKGVYSAIISNNGLIDKKYLKTKMKNYHTVIKLPFLNIAQAKEFTKRYLPNSTIKFLSKINKKYMVYNFEIEVDMKKPQDFYKFIEKINSLHYSMEIDYPIEFRKTTDTLHIKFNMKFNQTKPIIKQTDVKTK